MSECCYGFIWLIVVLVQNITDIKSDDALRVTILQQKAVEDLKRILLQKWLISGRHHFKGGSKQFPALSKTSILMGHNCHSLSIDTTIMVSKNCPITGEHVGIIFVTQYVTIATI